MSRGLAVASSNKASLPEILGEAAIYFDPKDKNDMAKKFTTIIKDSDLRQKLITAGLKQAKKYSWWECANQTLKIYNLVLNKNN